MAANGSSMVTLESYLLELVGFKSWAWEGLTFSLLKFSEDVEPEPRIIIASSDLMCWALHVILKLNGGSLRQCIGQGIMTYTFHPNTQKAEAEVGELLQVWGQFGLHHEAQVNQGCTVRPCLKTRKAVK